MCDGCVTDCGYSIIPSFLAIHGLYLVRDGLQAYCGQSIIPSCQTIHGLYGVRDGCVTDA